MARIEVKVPNIDDYNSLPVSALLVAVGDTVQKDQGLVTLAVGQDTIEVASPAPGVIKSLLVKVGDHVGEDAPVALLEVAGHNG